MGLLASSVVSMTCSRTDPGGGFGGHVHADFDELCLVVDDRTTIQHGGVDRPARHGDLFLFRAGERHAYRNGMQQHPHLWIVHYRRDPEADAACPRLGDRDAERRTWRLDAAAIAAFQALFLRLLAEHRGRGQGARIAERAWLRLLLVAVARFGTAAAQPPAPPAISADLLRLWQVVNDQVADPAGLGRTLARLVPNYDSLRHRFRKALGESPRDLLGRLRMERACGLLLESDLPVAAVARRLGYRRGAEFARAFVRVMGCAPEAWRRTPVKPR